MVILDRAELLAHEAAAHLRDPVVPRGEETEERAAHEDVVDVRDDEVRVRELHVDRHRPEEHARDAADSEHRDEAEREEHRCRQKPLASRPMACPTPRAASTFTPVGTAMSIVEAMKKICSAGSMPATNM